MKQTVIKVVFIMLTIASCGAEPIASASSPDVSAGYGNITLPAGNITNVLLYKVEEGGAPPVKSPHQCHTYANGDYFIENLEPGEYFLKGFMAGKEEFDLNFKGMKEEEFIKEAEIDVKPGALAYFGSYNVNGLDQNMQKTASFAIEHNHMAAKILILKHIKPDTQGTGWDRLIYRAMM